MEEVVSKFAGKVTLTEARLKDALHVPKKHFESLQATLDFSLVGKVHTTKHFNHNAFKRMMTTAWKLTSEIKIRELDDNVFLFVFGDMEDRERVFEMGLGISIRSFVVLHYPDGALPPHRMKLDHIDCWVQIHSLPLLGTSKVVGTMLATGVGICLEVDEGEDGDFWGMFMRVKVILDIKKPLKGGMILCLKGCKPCWVEFKYEASILLLQVWHYWAQEELV